MSNPAIEPAKLAAIRARQDYQQKLDAYNAAEERRLIRKANFGKQAFWGMIAFIATAAFFSMLQLPPEYPVSIFVLSFVGGTELFLIVAYLASLRANVKPIAPIE